MLLDHVLYQAQVTATGGRAGRAVSSDGVLEVQLTTPHALGGAGGRGTNPEQLFAAAYAASFLRAMQYVAARDTLAIPPESWVEGTVGIGDHAELGMIAFMPSTRSCRVMHAHQDVATILCILARHDPEVRKPWPHVRHKQE